MFIGASKRKMKSTKFKMFSFSDSSSAIAIIIKIFNAFILYTGIKKLIGILFNSIYYYSGVWNSTFWLGIPLKQNPCDCFIMQELINEVTPDFIIETGTFMGGSALYYAMLLEKINNKGKVITIDINPQLDKVEKHQLFKEKVISIKDFSTAEHVIQEVSSIVKGKKVLVTLDSDHSKSNVYNELIHYSKLVTLGSYIVIQDTNLNGHPILWYGKGPMEAVQEFIKNNDEFIIDKSREKFILTFNPSGYLKKVK